MTFSPNSASVSAMVLIREDSIVEDLEGFSLVLTEPSIGRISTTLSTIRGVIVDNDGMCLVTCIRNIIISSFKIAS